MIRWLKLGTGVSQKIKSNASRLFSGLALSILVFAQMACSGSIFYLVEPTEIPGAEISQSLSKPPGDPPPALEKEASPAATLPANPHPATETPSPEVAQATATTTPEPLPSDTPPAPENKPPVLYYAQAGDTLQAIALRFAVSPEEINSSEILPSDSLLNPKRLLIIPNRLGETSPSDHLLPDSEIVFAPSAVNFDIPAFVKDAGGYLSTYGEYLDTGWHSGAEIIARVAIENSINPRLLLSLLEFQSHWVYGKPTNLSETDYPIGWRQFSYRGLYKQLAWAVQQLNIGYYGWRDGSLTALEFPDKTRLRLAPDLNAGTVSVLYLFSKLNNPIQWGSALYAPEGLTYLHEKMFENPWIRAQTVEPLYPPNITQPELELPFLPGLAWSLTGGPHSAWGPDGALAALDFAPPSTETGCAESSAWVTASASGLVVRSGNGVVVIDLDGDGYEQTGWALLYLHVNKKDRVQTGVWVDINDPLGHPSCEGGSATGTHVHIARKYNGEWILADGPLPFILSGWRAHAGEKPYEGKLTRDGREVIACDCSSFQTRIERPRPTPTSSP